MKIIKHLIFLLIGSQMVFAQGQRKAVFIHGFGSDSTSWINKHTPTDLINPPDGRPAVIDTFITFDYSVGDTSQAAFSQLITALNNKILQNNQPGDEWIIIGHSLGGLITRAAEPHLLGFNLKGMLTIGTPHQGAPVASVVFNNAQGILDDAQTELMVGPNSGSRAITWVQAAVTDWGTLLAAWSYQDIFAAAYLEGKDHIKDALGPPVAEDYLGPHGSLIQQINSTPEMSLPHRSVIGSERSPTVIRWMSELSIQGASGYHEPHFTAYFNDIENWYSLNKNWWAAEEGWYQFWCVILCPPFGWGHCWESGSCSHMRIARGKKRAWNRGLAALNNIDETWSLAIGEHTEVGDGYYIWVPEHQKCWIIGSGIDDDIYQGGAVMREIRQGNYDFEQDICMPIFECRTIPAHWQYIGYSVAVGTKNDGLIQPEAARWNTNDAWTPEIPWNMYPENNYYYGDDPAIFEDGGWNHSEMMRFTRIYDGEDTGTPAAQVQTPLKANADDLRVWFND